ncbi:hypothetical protein EU546_01100 [Candidatus Thorarchaeota archaeon]|jgi:UPF0148 protein|nr:MAG: hypothetical protein EU546_01100 [Candidatus Thorarchaeota archaeon]
MMNERHDDSVKKMAELLRQGATMLAEACPQCGSPLLRVGEDIYCAKCNRRIVYEKSDRQKPAEGQVVKDILPELRETLIGKLDILKDVIGSETDTEALTRLANLMVLLLQALEKLEDMSR